MKSIKSFTEYSSYGVSRNWKMSRVMDDIIYSIENLLIDLKEKGIDIFINPSKSFKSISMLIDYREKKGNFNDLLVYIESLADFMSVRGFTKHSYSIINNGITYEVILEGGKFINDSDINFNNISCIGASFKILQK